MNTQKKEPTYEVLYNNKKIYFYYVENDHITTSWKNRQFYEQKLLEKIKSFKLNGLYVDVGSHHGNHSIYFEKFCNSDKVISIEGNPFNFKYLKENITRNKCKNMLINKIVSNKKDVTLTMEYNMGNTGMSRIVNSKINTDYKNSNNNIIRNTTNTLDNLLKNEENISLIKIDIENFEYYALLGGQNIITKHKPVIVIELQEANPYYREIISFLNTNNYETDGINYAFTPTFIYKCA